VKSLIRQRLLILVPTLFLATIVVFLLVQLIPGDPALAIAGEQATPEQLASIRNELGLNDPLPTQYGHWLAGVAQLDFGKSLRSGERVSTAIGRTLPTTLQIVFGGLIVSVLIGIPAGIASARRANTVTDRAISSATAAGIAVPNFWLGLILVSLFALRLGWFPATGFVGVSSNPYEAFRHIILPAFAIGVVGAAEVARQLRAAMVEVLAADFIRTHRAKGLRQRAIVWRHALKNAAVPLVTILGLQVNRSLGATVVIETVFGIAGLGNLVVGATLQKDFPVIQGVILTMVLIVVVTNLLVDVAYRVIDPRIR
jgi:peptide/nickel transport system permease protein